MVLERIQKEDDIKKLKESELDTLAEEISQFLAKPRPTLSRMRDIF